MFLTISTTGSADRPATDLGFLLHKHPDKAQQFSTSHGTAHVLYPEADAQRCTAALLLEVDPIALVRRGRGKGRGGAPDSALGQYVNDRPYAASSLLAVALRSVFASAMKGQCTARPELVTRRMPLRIEVPVLPARGGAVLVRKLFEPLGWTVQAEPLPLDETFPEWGDSRYVRLVLEGESTLAGALRHLYVLLPVLDDAKHYWVAPDEVDKLLRAGEGWLEDHPEQRLIVGRYLARRWSLTRQAMERLELERLAESDDMAAEVIDNAVDEEADTEEKPLPLAVRRREAILTVLRSAEAARVLDLGCGPGQLVGALLKEGQFTEIVGVDVSMRALHEARRRLRLDRMPERQSERVRLVQGSLAYTDGRLKGYDAAVLSEVVEHVDPARLPALEYAVFGSARPRTVVVTTPNVEYNVRWESLPAGQARHADHRFEWTRDEFRQWAGEVAARHGYEVSFAPVGPDDPEVGPPTQLAHFRIHGEGGGNGQGDGDRESSGNREDSSTSATGKEVGE
ncbi:MULTISPECIES: 3' terminal RNA ribose 2'-O-methyltransferase Hen1 [unclassified Streptomyces]|uniref:3' terminal RNA ribose 2'-O-methyltransferase Hen1 n=1 Tax=unclassified Streptomyces TaxID=2593676 RepID=UPI00088D52B8|nr:MULTISPECIES: 3' terminal RNA ribose 2'-O-methyltransferase Hen1 [unclassified Streptomyces]PBC85588.1 3' terminal RNA ribose 2'-O-methyltransferase Hen1 [Streptomyces sp. 2321.6]SDR11154.1 3' terminal RNA ribose 2'-O-methyltransferase Hen1 [Streptomyces sp. KS_16]SED72821.1 3' terminal RNA ribose 2'-O-methyltransferase Hen1 [Streptomyces sp. 2133.1]SEE08130.1 3' terminal RNA ribose 2'-O-methyltransferase Hen1 [Streptomyces sp. 2112.3]SNC72205.1 3' terminal RNA ribose 2'-O-methyltransferase